MKIECTKEELLAYGNAQYQLGMMDDENDLAVGIAEYLDDLFIALHKVV